MIDYKFKILPNNKPLTLENETCVYCAKVFADKDWTKEHVVGRRFVPKGKFDKEWNLIVCACHKCNNIKAALEDDISAITMQPDAAGKHSIDDELLRSESERNGKNCFSRKTGKPVNKSVENLKINVPFSHNAKFTFHVIAPPQIESNRTYELARLQLMGFFYMITYNPETRRGGFWPGYFIPVLEAIRDDWGNPVHMGFMRAVKEWELRLLFVGADGFFKMIIRRHPSEECWSWALEWNHNLRIVGFFCQEDAALKVKESFSPLNTVPIGKDNEGEFGIRRNIGLRKEDDRLFEWVEVNA